MGESKCLRNVGRKNIPMEILMTTLMTYLTWHVEISRNVDTGCLTFAVSDVSEKLFLLIHEKLISKLIAGFPRSIRIYGRAPLGQRFNASRKKNIIAAFKSRQTGKLNPSISWINIACRGKCKQNNFPSLEFFLSRQIRKIHTRGLYFHFVEMNFN